MKKIISTKRLAMILFGALIVFNVNESEAARALNSRITKYGYQGPVSSRQSLSQNSPSFISKSHRHQQPTTTTSHSHRHHRSDTVNSRSLRQRGAQSRATRYEENWNNRHPQAALTAQSATEQTPGTQNINSYYRVAYIEESPTGSWNSESTSFESNFQNSPVTNPFAKKRNPSRTSSFLPIRNDTGTVIEITSSNPTFTTFVTALQVAGLIDELNDSGPYTVLAPTNEAFAKLPPGTVQTLFKPENKEKLRDILTYHIIKGKVMTPDLKRSHLQTENGKMLDITHRGRDIYIDNAEVVNTDITGSNGVIHVVDAVLIP